MEICKRFGVLKQKIWERSINSQRPIGLLVFVHHNFSIISFVETFAYLQKIKKQTNKQTQTKQQKNKQTERT